MVICLYTADITHSSTTGNHIQKCERQMKLEIDYHTGDDISYSFPTVCGFFNELQFIIVITAAVPL